MEWWSTGKFRHHSTTPPPHYSNTPLYLQSLEVNNFRNFSTQHFEFSPEVNIVHGPNASGKTNLLEAIYILSNLRSFRTHRLPDLIQWGQPQASIRGIVRTDTQKSIAPDRTGEDTRVSGKTLAVKIEPKARTAFLQTKLCRSSKDYLQVLPSTAFIPDDLDLVKGLPAARRFFLDRGTFQLYPLYWSVLTDYKKNLQQKNAILRQYKETRWKKHESRSHSLGTANRKGDRDIWNEQLRQVGSQVILQRLRFVQEIRRVLPGIYLQWLGNTETLDVRYQSSIRLEFDKIAALLTDPNVTQAHLLEHIAQAYEKALERSLERELRIGSTIVGPHRDDLVILQMERELRSFGSQGQQRTAVLALKMAEVILYFEQHQEYAVLLLDDVTSELDDRRTERLFEYVQHGMQVFISTTNKPDLPVDRSLSCAYFDLNELK